MGSKMKREEIEKAAKNTLMKTHIYQVIFTLKII